MAPPPGTFQSRKSGDMGMSFALNSNGICNMSIGFDTGG
jgi:hypothetical protein